MYVQQWDKFGNDFSSLYNFLFFNLFNFILTLFFNHSSMFILQISSRSYFSVRWYIDIFICKNFLSRGMKLYSTQVSAAREQAGPSAQLRAYGHKSLLLLLSVLHSFPSFSWRWDFVGSPQKKIPSESRHAAICTCSRYFWTVSTCFPSYLFIPPSCTGMIHLL